MKLTVFALPNSPRQVDVEAELTENPELAIFAIDVLHLRGDHVCGARSPRIQDAPMKGKVWAVAHVPTGTIVIYALLTRDLALETARMITAAGWEFGQDKTIPFEMDAFQAGVKMMTDWYFQIFSSAVGPAQLAPA